MIITNSCTRLIQVFLSKSYMNVLLEVSYTLEVLSFILVNNMRMKLDRMAVALEELATKGPIKPEALRGLENLDEYVKAEDLTVINGLKEMPHKTGTREVVDPQHYRTGWLMPEELCKQYLEESMKAK